MWQEHKAPMLPELNIGADFVRINYVLVVVSPLRLPARARSRISFAVLSAEQKPRMCSSLSPGRNCQRIVPIPKLSPALPPRALLRSQEIRCSGSSGLAARKFPMTASIQHASECLLHVDSRGLRPQDLARFQMR